MADGALREAEQLSRRMQAIWPDLPGGHALRQEIVRRYPMVIVGVAEIAGRQDATSIDSWSARRTGRLTQRTCWSSMARDRKAGNTCARLGTTSRAMIDAG